MNVLKPAATACNQTELDDLVLRCRRNRHQLRERVQKAYGLDNRFSKGISYEDETERKNNMESLNVPSLIFID